RAARIEGERQGIPNGLVRTALEHPAVDEDLRPLGDEQVLRAGDGRRATEKVDLHWARVPARAACPRILEAHGHHERRTVFRRATRGVRRPRWWPGSGPPSSS